MTIGKYVSYKLSITEDTPSVSPGRYADSTNTSTHMQINRILVGITNGLIFFLLWASARPKSIAKIFSFRFLQGKAFESLQQDLRYDKVIIQLDKERKYVSVIF